MKSGKLLDAIGMVGDDLIDEARAPQKKVIQWKHWTAIAACLALLITVLSIIKPLQPGQPDIIGPDSLHSNPITIPFTSPSDTPSDADPSQPSVQTDPTLPQDPTEPPYQDPTEPLLPTDPTEPPYHPGSIMQLSASPENGYIGNKPTDPPLGLGSPHFRYSNVTAKALAILPDTYTYFDTWGASDFRLIIMQTIKDITGSGIPKYFYLHIREADLTDLTQYNSLVLLHLDQETIENSVLYNKNKGAAEVMRYAIFSSWDVYAYNNTLVYSTSEHAIKETLTEMEQSMTDHCSLCDEAVSIRSIRELDVNGNASAIAYTAPFDNGIFAPVGFFTLRRYINGIPTNELVSLLGKSQTEYIRGEAFTDADIVCVPDVAAAIKAVDQAFQNGQITPPHIVDYKDRELKSYGIRGWYFKSDGKVYAAIQINFAYDTDDNDAYMSCYYDDAYFIVEAGSDSCEPISRDDLWTLQDTNDFIFRGEYDEKGKMPSGILG